MWQAYMRDLRLTRGNVTLTVKQVKTMSHRVSLLNTHALLCAQTSATEADGHTSPVIACFSAACTDCVPPLDR